MGPVAQFPHRVISQGAAGQSQMVKRNSGIYLNLLSYTYLEEDFSDILSPDLHMSCASLMDVLHALTCHHTPSLSQSCHFTASQALSFYPFSRFHIIRCPGTWLVKRTSLWRAGVRGGSREWWSREKQGDREGGNYCI